MTSASSSQEQVQVETHVRQLLEKQLMTTFAAEADIPRELSLVSLDAYAPGAPPLVVEIFAHFGACKPGQKRKLSRDMAKLLLAEKLLGCECRKVIAVLDKQAVAHLQNGWDGRFAIEFGIEVLVVGVAEDAEHRIRAAQSRQAEPFSAKSQSNGAR